MMASTQSNLLLDELPESLAGVKEWLEPSLHSMYLVLLYNASHILQTYAKIIFFLAAYNSCLETLKTIVRNY